MANKSLTDLTARTATADSDLIHVNSGGTDYKETKINFLKGSFGIEFSNTTNITTQADALPDTGTYYGTLISSGHQTETGTPLATFWYVRILCLSAYYKVIDLWGVDDPQANHYIKCKKSNTWQTSWTLDPTRAEITSLNNSLTKSYDTGILSDITIASNREASIDKPSALIGKEIVSINILSWSSASGVFFIAGMYDASPRFFIGGDPGTVIKGLNLRIWYKG